ncbi:MAG TPA: response regulator [Puia sp.]|nr:response regulator [Puia sp.]
MAQPLHVLLVDDDADDREIFTWTMSNIYPSAVIDMAIDGQDALEKLEQWEYCPDIIFVDLNMPRMNGFDFLKEIRQMDRWKELPVIVYSTSSNPKDMARSWQAGATDYIVKGTDMASVKRDILQALEKFHPPLPEHEYRK